MSGRVVGGPVVADGRVLALVQGGGTAVWLEARSGTTGRLVWRVRQGFSEITPGVAVAPVAAGGVAFALLPASSDTVRLAGISIANGHELWRGGQDAYVTDAPGPCPPPLGNKAFCVIAAESVSAPTALVALAPRTGKPLVAVGNVERAMGLRPGLYQTNQAAPTLAQVKMPGGRAWSRPFAALFGAGYAPDNGWIFDRVGADEVGSVGHGGGGKTENLAVTETVGIDAATGRRRWRDHGEFECGGFSPLSVPYLCLMTGTATSPTPGTVKPSAGASLTLAGFDARSGRITWRRPIGGVAAVLEEKAVIADSRRLLVTTRAGAPEIVDLRTGRTSAPAATAAFWCQHVGIFHAARGSAGLRVGGYTFDRCDADGRRVSIAAAGLPRSASTSAVGARLGRLFVWGSPDGLHAAPVAR